ncbi:MAG: EscN/YscN/HrcN family type III secretion system ATPase, partial [Epsilonproteobacteria bacterium]
VLIRIGAYTKGSDPELDEAIAKKSEMEKFLTQDATLRNGYEDTVGSIVSLMNEGNLL